MMHLLPFLFTAGGSRRATRLSFISMASSSLSRPLPAATTGAFGHCAHCGVVHAIPRTEEAMKAAKRLHENLDRAGRVDFDSSEAGDFLGRGVGRPSPPPLSSCGPNTSNNITQHPWQVNDLSVSSLQTKRGKMMGVLVCVDKANPSGPKVVLKAFAGKIGGFWTVPGWAPPLYFENTQSMVWGSGMPFGVAPEALVKFSVIQAQVWRLAKDLERIDADAAAAAAAAEKKAAAVAEATQAAANIRAEVGVAASIGASNDNAGGSIWGPRSQRNHPTRVHASSSSSDTSSGASSGAFFGASSYGASETSSASSSSSSAGSSVSREEVRAEQVEWSRKGLKELRKHTLVGSFAESASSFVDDGSSGRFSGDCGRDRGGDDCGGGDDHGGDMSNERRSRQPESTPPQPESTTPETTSPSSFSPHHHRRLTVVPPRTMFDVHLRRPLVPVGTGDCCAPKLVAHAIRLGLIPVGIAEFYYGKSPRSATKKTKRSKSPPRATTKAAAVAPYSQGLLPEKRLVLQPQPALQPQPTLQPPKLQPSTQSPPTQSPLSPPPLSPLQALVFHDSCEPRCQQVLGYMLCGLSEAREGAMC